MSGPHQRAKDAVMAIISRGGRIDHLADDIISAVQNTPRRIDDEIMADTRIAPNVDIADLLKEQDASIGHVQRVTDARLGRNLEPIPKGVYWSEQGSNFYSLNGGGRPGMGLDFYERWAHRRAEFPQDDDKRPDPNINRSPSRDEVRKSEYTALTAHEQELLTILSEECAEVIIQISKLKRFGRVGIDRSARPHKRYDNIMLLGYELGDVKHMVDVLAACELVPESLVQSGAVRKQEQLAKYLQTRKS